MSDYFRQKAAPIKFGSGSWVILNGIESSIKHKVEKTGTPLKDWDINIYRGILTGYNEAFIINKEVRDKLVAKSSKNAEIIRPILRGRDIHKYKADWSNLYIIGTFPSLKIDIDDFPAVRDHLLSFGKNRLEQNGKIGARKKTNNQWFETQDSISYWDDFFRPKVIWGEISDKSKFAYDEESYFIEATSFLMTGKNLKYLLGMLNSKLLEWYFNQIGTATGVGTNRWKKYTIELLPIKEPSKTELEIFEKLINEAIKNPKGADGIFDKINNFIYNLYDLTEEEIQFITNVNV